METIQAHAAYTNVSSMAISLDMTKASDCSALATAATKLMCPIEEDAKVRSIVEGCNTRKTSDARARKHRSDHVVT